MNFRLGISSELAGWLCLQFQRWRRPAAASAVGSSGLLARAHDVTQHSAALARIKALLHLRIASARAKNVFGILRPIAFAVLRLMASSNFVGCSMGMSFGCLPCRILCTNLAPCRTEAGPSAPNAIRPPISANERVVEAAGKRYLMAISVR